MLSAASQQRAPPLLPPRVQSPAVTDTASFYGWQLQQFFSRMTKKKQTHTYLIYM